MKTNSRKNIFLLIITLYSISAVYFILKFSYNQEVHKEFAKMKHAETLAGKWFELITNQKAQLNRISEEARNMKYSGLIGIDYSDITTTLGNLEAKQTSVNPAFSALILRWMNELNIDSTKTVGIILSGSFPALAVNTLAAVQTLKSKAVIISSLGASSYGANEPDFTWIDYEKLLIDKGGLIYKTDLLTAGSDEDNGFGLQQEGIDLLKVAAVRNNYTLYFPAGFDESVNLKEKLFDKSKIDVLINIGGNQTALGKCNHGINIPNGLQRKLRTCNCSDRGLIFRFNEKGIPVIHLLNIRDLAVKYGLPIAPINKFSESDLIYKQKAVNKLHIILILIGMVVLLFFYRKIIRLKKK